MQTLRQSITLQVLVGIICGVVLGYFVPSIGPGIKILSDIFIRLIRMVIGPVIFCTVVSGIASHRDIKEAGRIGLASIVYFELMTTFSIIIGLVVVNVMKPGVGIDISHVDPSQITHYVEGAKQLSAFDHILQIVPTSIFDALARNDLLQVLFFSIVCGVAMALLGEKAKPLSLMIGTVSEVIFTMLHIVIRFAPLAAFGAMAYTVSVLGVDALLNLFQLVLTVYLTMIFFVFVVLGVVCRLSGFRLLTLLAFIKQEIIITIGTSSSEAVLPRLIERLEAFGCEREVVALVIPTGYSFNLDGTSVYLSAAAVFIAQAYGIDLSLWQEISLVLLVMLTSKGAAAVAGGGFITLAATLSATHILPVEGLFLLLGVDRFMSEARAVTNMIGNSVAAVVIDRFEKRRKLKLQ